MSLLPQYLDLKDVYAQAGTTRVRAVESQWVVGLDRRLNEYAVWGPRFVAGGWAPICWLDRRADGKPDIDAFIIAQQRARMENIAPERRAEMRREHNEAVKAREKRAQLDVARSKVAYGRKAVQAELNGASRWKKDDVLNGLRMAEQGRLKAPPVGRVIFAPGAK